MPKITKECKKEDCANLFESWPASNKRYCSPECRYTDPELIKLLGGSIKAKHKLSDIDSLNLIATCEVCGITDIRVRSEPTKFPNRPPIYRCRTAERTRNRAIATRISRESFIKQLTVQQYLCAICKKTINEITARIDHDHRCCSGKNSCGKCIRGILCNTCNTALGAFKDDENILINAIRYLKSWPWMQTN